MARPTINGIELEGVSTIGAPKTANILPFPMPTGDSDETETFDMLGVIRTLNIVGQFSGEIATIKAKVDSIYALINGNQNNVNFVSDQTGTVSVKISEFDPVWNVPGTICDFTLKLIEGV